jgi:hypothetical protein
MSYEFRVLGLIAKIIDVLLVIWYSIVPNWLTFAYDTMKGASFFVDQNLGVKGTGSGKSPGRQTIGFRQ